MSEVRSRNGDRLVAFRPGEAAVVPDDLAHLPLEFAVVVATLADEVLLVYNPRRQEWELPAGLIKPDEAPAEAARRELAEESGQLVPDLRAAGLLLLHLQRGDRLELGAVYTGELEALLPFQENPESTRMRLWDGRSPVAEHVNEIAVALWKLVKGHRL